MASNDGAVAVFEALAHPARRHILALLNHSGGELPSGYLASRFSHSWPTTTRHLHVLEQAGLVEVRREGRSSHYRLCRERALKVLQGMIRNLTPTGPEKTWQPTGSRSTRLLRAQSSPRGKAK
ncbi:MAG TPA: metalloregulator ArsR/SmtB family transcription factor [Polyangiaceae bacterium]